MKEKENLFNTKGIIIGLIIFILFYYSSLLQLIPINVFHLNIEKISGAQQVMLSTFSNIILLLLLVFIFRKELKTEWTIFKNKFLTNIDLGIKYWIVGLFIMMVSNIIISFILKNGQAANEQAVQKMISNLPWLMVINAGILAPFIEEIVFRKCFKKAFPHKWMFILSSAIVFGSLHIIPSFTSPLEFLYVIPYGALGGAFAYMYSKTDTIYTSIAMHMFHNTALTLLSILL